MILLSIYFGSCHRNSTDSEKPVIAVSFDSQRYLLQQIAGDDFDCIVLLPPGADPEMFDPDMRTMKALEKSTAYLTTSTLGFESEVGRRIARNYPEKSIFDLSAGIDILEHTHNVAEKSHHHEDEHDVGGDPHLLSSLKNAETVSRNLLEALIRLNPDSSAVYRKRFQDLNLRLSSVDRRIDSLLTVNGKKNTAFVVTHPSLSYYARDYSLKQIPLEKDGKEASPRQLEERLRKAMVNNPSILVYEKSGSASQAAEIASHLGIMSIPVYLNGDDFVDELIKVTQSIAEN